jgi:hypothetical protein
MKTWKKYWQGHDPSELLLILVAMLVIASVLIGVLHVALGELS